MKCCFYSYVFFAFNQIGWLAYMFVAKDFDVNTRIEEVGNSYGLFVACSDVKETN